MKKTVESVVLVKKSMLISTDEDDTEIDHHGSPSGVLCSGSHDQNTDGSPSGNLPPEIQVRICEKTVLVRIHCENHKGVLVKLLSEIEKLHLSVTNASSMPFVGLFLDITVSAQASYKFLLIMTNFLQQYNPK